MIGANKILTVSYGTFSCTLEGFDEPFTTMKAIAEYFRDLAAEDRYFGAEPPTPDAEMLHRIAEREIQRRVEAKISENAVILRQVEMPAPAPAAEVAEAPFSVPAEAVRKAAPVQTETPAAPDATAASSGTDDSISDKLRRIRAVVTHAQGQPVASVADAAFYEDLSGADAGLAPETTEYAEPMDDDFGFTLELDPEDLSDVLSLNEPDTGAEEAPAEVAAIATAEPAQPTDADTPDLPASAAAEAAGWDVLEADIASSDISREDPAAPEAAAPVELPVAAEANETEVSLDALDGILAQAGQDTPDALIGADWDIAETIARDLADRAVATPDAPQADTEDDTTEAAVWDAIEQAPPSHPLAVDPAAASNRSEVEIWDEVESMAAHPVVDHHAGTAATELPEPESEQDDAPMSPLASLLARTRAHVLGNQTAGADEEEQAEALPDAANADEEGRVAEDMAETADAAPEADDDLIAGIEAAIGAIDEREAAAASEEEADAGRTAAAGRTMLADDAEEDDDFERLMEEANTKLEGAESRRRFSAISHLKAAVAATVADRILKPKDAPAEAIAPSEPEIDRYRDDLSRAVRPRRPDAEGDRVTARPAMPMRPAPLVLVSEQRVDRENLQPAAAVRPRRVATTLIVGDDDLNDAEPLSPEDAKSFTDFAERLGARSLAELLEVAAVYTATVEGKDSFSRPHLLRRVNAATGVEDFSREDYLRSFGSLLRQGRIQKVEPGRFSVTDVSPFMTEMRRAAN